MTFRVGDHVRLKEACRHKSLPEAGQVTGVFVFSVGVMIGLDTGNRLFKADQYELEEPAK